MDKQGQIIGVKQLDFVTAAGSNTTILQASYPNPANPSMTIPFVLTETGEVSLIVYNMLGQQIRNLFQGNKPAGRWDINWDGRDKTGSHVSSGTYLIHLEIKDSHGTRTFTRKALIQK